MRQTTTLRSKIFESSLRWNIENFIEFAECGIERIESETVEIEGTDASWKLFVHPNHSHSPNDYVKLSVEVTDKTPSEHHFFKVDVRTDLNGHRLLSPENRHLVRAEGMYAQPHEVEAAVWCVDFSKLPENGIASAEWDYIKVDDLGTYLSSGVLPLIAQVSLKKVIIVNTFK